MKTLDELAKDLADVDRVLATIGKLRYEIEGEIQQAMEADGATVAMAGNYRMALSREKSYDSARLMGLLELLSEKELFEAGAYTAEHVEEVKVPARWNVVRLRPFLARGQMVRDVVEAATVYGRTKLQVTRVKKTRKSEEGEVASGSGAEGLPDGVSPGDPAVSGERG